MGGTRNDAVEWNWSHVPRLLVQSILYPMRAGDPLGLLRAVLVGGLLISPFMFVLFGLGRRGMSEAWRSAMDVGGSAQVMLGLIVVIVVLFAIVPLGYLLRVVQHASVGDGELPMFRGRRRLATLGIRVATVYFFYLLFPLDILIRFIGVFSEAMPVIRTLIPEATLVFIVFLYLYPAAVASFAEEERLLSALPQRLQSTLWSRTYTVGAITSGLIGGVIYVIRFPLSPESLELVVPIGLITFYLFVAQHYVIGRTWRAVEAEKAASEPLETPSGDPIPSERLDTGELRDRGVLSTEDTAAIRGRFEAAMRAPDPDTEELLGALRTLYERGVFTEEEYEEKRREVLSTGERAHLETGSTSEPREGPTKGSDGETTATSRDEPPEERPVTSEDRTEGVGGEASPDRAGFDRESTSTGGTARTGDVDGAEDAPDRLDRFAMLRQLYGQDVLTKQEYEAKQRKLGPDRETGASPGDAGSDLAERFATLQGLYDRGLLTEEEYHEKRRDLLEEF